MEMHANVKKYYMVIKCIIFLVINFIINAFQFRAKRDNSIHPFFSNS